MVLNDLGRKISSALSKLGEAPIIDEQVLNGLLKEVCNALVHADVDMKLVLNLRKKIKAGVDLESTAAGISRRKKIEEVLFFPFSFEKIQHSFFVYSLDCHRRNSKFIRCR